MKDRPWYLRDTDRDCIAQLDVPGAPVICELKRHGDDVLHRNGATVWADASTGETPGS